MASTRLAAWATEIGGPPGISGLPSGRWKRRGAAVAVPLEAGAVDAIAVTVMGPGGTRVPALAALSGRAGRPVTESGSTSPGTVADSSATRRFDFGKSS